MPGEDTPAALAAAAELERSGTPAILTLLGESVSDESETQQTVAQYTSLLSEIDERGLHAEISVKLTHLGLDLEPRIAESNLCAIATAAGARKNVVWVDMEGSSHTQATLDVFRRVRSTRENVGICLQAYLYRTAEDVETLVRERSMIRLVKGAYAEPPAIAYPNKKDVDASFLRLAERLLGPDATAAGLRVGFATHDLELIAKIKAAAGSRGLSRGASEFEMLYGIQREAQRKLAEEGYPVRVLISYGSSWFPWYMRRLAERPANLAFVFKNLFAR